MKVVADHKVVNIQYFSEENYVIQMESPVDIPKIKPGNFAEIKVDNTPGVFLRRPFSILDVDYENKLISFYVKVIGKGTRYIGLYEIGDQINLIYPLGNSFTVSDKDRKVLIVGGGSGIAPFILLGKEMVKNGIEATFLIGGRSQRDIILTKEFAKYGDVLVTTEDGSLGEKGLVTQHSVFISPQFKYDRIYACGPDPMMKAVAIIAQQKEITCEVSLENTMACGFGICLCCVTATQEGNKRVCLEGPVFNSRYLKWQI
ncbi:MAG: dihydroorotate dehydrogenase electron transfer subunit [Bacteroidales bacterium]|nr:dihydroorotate dehydrogenase electron transfer subunit [Bacteroidales bacterium]